MALSPSETHELHASVKSLLEIWMRIKLAMQRALGKEPITKDNEIGIHKKQKQEFSNIGSIRIVKGLTLFSFNTVTLEIKKVEVRSYARIKLDGKVQNKHKAYHEANLVYAQALNKRNAIKKFRQNFPDRIKEYEYKQRANGKI